MFKKSIVFSVLLLSSFSALPQHDVVPNKNECLRLSELAYDAFNMHQLNIPIYLQISVDTPRIDIYIIIGAYNMPRYVDNQQQREAMIDYSNKVLLTCKNS